MAKIDICTSGGGYSDSRSISVAWRCALAMLLAACALTIAALGVSLDTTSAYAADGVYAFVCTDDDGTSTMVIKKGTDEPTGYGTVVSDWHQTTSAHKPIDLTDDYNTNADGGIGTGSSYSVGKGTANAYPWRSGSENDESLRNAVKKVVVADGVQLSCVQYLFAGFVNCEEFDLSGLDTSKVPTQKYYPSSYFDAYAKNYMFGNFSATSTTADKDKPCKSTKKIITGTKWTIPVFFGFFNDSKTDKTSGTAFYFTARNNVVTERAQYYQSKSVPSAQSIYGSASRYFWNYLPIDGYKHIYYTDKATCVANQESDYKLCYGETDSSLFKDTFLFSKQPYDQAGYIVKTDASGKAISVGTSFSSWTVLASLSGANGISGEQDMTYQWYKGTALDDSKAVLSGTGTMLNPFGNARIAKEAGYAYYYATATSTEFGYNASGMSNVVKVTAFDPDDGPVLGTQPAGTDPDAPVQYAWGQKATALSVKVANTSLNNFKTKYGLSDNPTLSYQWYRASGDGDFEAIEGATTQTYTPDTRELDPGEYRYYCKLTYTVSTYAHGVPTITTTTKSDVSYMRIYEAGVSAGTPAIESIAMADASYTGPTASVSALQVKASVPEGVTGTLTYQWFASSDNVANPEAGEDGESDEAVTEKTEVGEDGVISFTPLISHSGDTWYYCVVTNSLYAETEEDSESSVTSALVHITFPTTVHVSTAAQLSDVLRDATTYAGYTIALDNDIDLTAYAPTAEWTSQSFADAIFDGCGHTITMNASSGLFSSVDNATVKNLTLEGSSKGASVTNSATNSTFEGVISRCSVEASTGTKMTGGLIREAANITMKNCGNEGNVTGVWKFSGWSTVAGYVSAGLVGQIENSTISGCYNTGTISAHGAAGLVGALKEQSVADSEANNLTIENSYNAGTIVSIALGSSSTGDNYNPGSAGLVGANTLNSETCVLSLKGTLTITNCFNAGDLKLKNPTKTQTDEPDGDQGGIGSIYHVYKVSSTTANVPTVNMSNTYALSGLTWKNNNGATEKTSAELASADMVSTLNGDVGTAWKEGAAYPVLSWQAVDGAAKPTVTDQAETSFVTSQGTAFSPITISAQIPAEVKSAYRGTLTYQWYSNTAASTKGGTAIANATTASYTPSCETIGTAYYYCVVTNTYATGAKSATSAVYEARTRSAAPAAVPQITVQPASASYAYGDTLAPLSVTASVSGEGAGDLTYQWYQMKGETADPSTDTKISKATEQTYQPQASAGDTSYYCVVTNTFEEDKTATTVTSVATVSVSSSVTISTPADLKKVSDNVNAGTNYSGVVVKLTNDIDLASDDTTRVWTPIGGSKDFYGEFDGGGHTISGLNVVGTSEGYEYLALFGSTYKANLHDFSVIGMVTGMAESSSYTAYAAGVAAYAHTTTFKNVISKVNVSKSRCIGGIAGYTRSTCVFESCGNYGNIEGSEHAYNQGAGGIVGITYNSGNTFSNCYNRGTISGTVTANSSGVGGIAGSVQASTYTNCYNAGKVSATGSYKTCAGPIVGRSRNKAANFTNVHYLAGTCETNGSTSGTDLAAATEQTDETMKDKAFVSTINADQSPAQWKAGDTYPLLSIEGVELANLPIITTQPQSASYSLNASSVTALSVEVTGVENPSYQWYSNTKASVDGATALDGATTKTFTPPVTTASTTYYYCKVSAGSTTVQSSIAEIFVASATPAATPSVTTQPVSAGYYTGGEAAALSVVASVSGAGAGELSYQWYKMSGTTPNVEADTAIEGATEASYVPETKATASYYCVVTNTFERLKTAQTTSQVATITCTNKVVKITNLDELVAFRNDVNAGNDYFGVTVELEKGVYDLSQVTTWTPIGGSGASSDTLAFRGEFDGNGSTIKHASVLASSYVCSIFGCVDGGTVENLVVEDVTNANTSLGVSAPIGSVVNRAVNATVQNVCASGNLRGMKGSTDCATGGIVGYAENSVIDNVSFDGNVDAGPSYTGGIVGSMTGGSLSNAVMTGAVNGVSRGTGGIVGMLAGASVTNVANNASVKSTNSTAGGIVAVVEANGDVAATITASKNSGSVYDSSNTACGGIAGSVADKAEINACYNTGEVTSTTSYSSTRLYTGGIAGSLEAGSKLSNCYSTGVVNAYNACAGGLIGLGASSDISNCYYASSGYPTDVTGIKCNLISDMQKSDFVARINGAESGYYVYNPESTPALYWETPHYLYDNDVTVSDSVSYTGAAVEPEVSVTFAQGDTVATLVRDVDYTVTCSDNVMPGTATVVIEGIGDYRGTITKTFKVTKAQISVTAQNTVKRMGTSDPELSYEVSGNAEGDEVRYVALNRSAGETAGTYQIIASGGIVVRGNMIVTDAYDFSYTPATFEITDGAALEEAIKAATAAKGNVKVSVDGSDVLPADTWVTQAQFDALNAAISSAQATFDDAQATQAAINAQVTSVKQAQSAFEAAGAAGTKATDAAWSRLAGDSRFDTMASISSTGFEVASTVLVASGENFPDALAATALAGYYKAPIILTSAAELSSQAAAEIERLGATKAILVGGTASLSESVANALTSKNITVERISGTSRVETALEVYKSGAKVGAWGKTAIVTTGQNFADALSISSFSYAKAAPVFLASDGVITDEVAKAIREGGFERVIIVGGTAAVSDSVKDQIGGSITFERLAGDNRYETSSKIAQFCLDEGMSANGIAIAYGGNFPDALAGGALCGSTNSIIMLVDEENTNYATSMLSTYKWDIHKAYVLGGTASVSSNLMDDFEAACK